MIRQGLLSHTRTSQSGSGGGGGHGPLSLVPMIDILMILVVYLLVHAADAELLPNPHNVSMPMSVSEVKPRDAKVITVSEDAVYVDGRVVITLPELRAGSEPVVETLRAALGDGEASTAEDGGREITVMAEKTLSYPVLKRIVATAAAADYRKVSFAVTEREQVFAGRPAG
jgi:biopolymer transport protein ExbD